MHKLSLHNVDSSPSHANIKDELGNHSRKRECQQDSLKDLTKKLKFSDERLDGNCPPIEREQRPANHNDWRATNQGKGQVSTSTLHWNSRDHFQNSALSNIGNSTHESGLVRRDEKRYSGQSGASMHTDDGGGDGEEGDTSMLLQPETKPITQEQLVNEVKGIYAGLVVSLPPTHCVRLLAAALLVIDLTRGTLAVALCINTTSDGREEVC